MSPRLLILVLLSASMLALMSVGALACTSRGTPSGSGAPVRSTATTTAAAPASLPALGPLIANVDWTLSWFVLDGKEYYATDGPPITLRMDPKGASVSGASGCNRYSGTYVAEGVALHLQLTAVSRATCSASVTTREHAYRQALSRVEAYGSTIAELMLGSVDGQTLLKFIGRFAPAPTTTVTPTATMATSPLRPGVAGRTWALTRFSQDGRAYPLVTIGPITLWLGTPGTPMAMGGHDGCNAYSGIYNANGATLRLRLGDLTQVACAPPTIELLEGEYLDALGFVDTYRLESGQLVLTSGGGRLQLMFRELPCQNTVSAQAHGAVPLPLSGTPLAATPCPAA